MQKLKSSKKLNRSLRFFFCFVVIVSLLFSCFAIPGQAVLTEAAIVGGVCLALAAAAGITLTATGNFTSSGLAEGVGSAFQSASNYVYDAADFVFHPSSSTLQAAVEVAPDVYNKFRSWISGLNLSSSPSSLISSSLLTVGDYTIPSVSSPSIPAYYQVFSLPSSYVFDSQQDFSSINDSGDGFAVVYDSSRNSTRYNFYRNNSVVWYFACSSSSYRYLWFVISGSSIYACFARYIDDNGDYVLYSRSDYTSELASVASFSPQSLTGSVADTGPNLLDQIDDQTDSNTKVWVTDPVISDLVNPSLDSFLENLTNRILTGAQDLSGVQAQEATAQPEVSSDSDEPSLTPTGFLPYLPSLLDNIAGIFSSIWQYVVNWVSSISPFLTLMQTVWSKLPYAMVLPVYASAVVVIVLGMWRRFFE